MNCLIFGYGYMGKIRYQVLARHPDVDQIHVLDPHTKPGPGFDGAWLAPEEPIHWDRYDAVFVCTPNNVTAGLCVEAIQRGRHVFCEKPPGRNWEDFCRIADAAAAAPEQILMFGFNHRLHPAIQAAKALIGPGGLGDVLYVKGTYGKSGGARYRESWRNKPDISGGGILLDQGIHMLDLFHVFLGPMSAVDATLSDAFWHCGVEDNAMVLLRSQRGVPAFLHSSATLWKHTFRLEIGCQDGYLAATGLLSQSGSYGREQLVIGKRQFEHEAMALGNPREEIIHFDRDDSWDREVAEFVTAVHDRRPGTHGTLEEARHVMEIIRDVYAAADMRAGARPS